jgi:hypothetical protein
MAIGGLHELEICSQTMREQFGIWGPCILVLPEQRVLQLHKLGVSFQIPDCRWSPGGSRYRFLHVGR